MASIERERRAFEAMLDDLLTTQAGRFALVCDGELIGTYDTFDEAYGAGLDRFGPDVTFLVSQIRRDPELPISISWDAGVLLSGH